MEYKLTLSVFRFDAKTDYLPYYKKIVVKQDEDSSVSNILETIKEDEKDFGYPTDANAAIKINDTLVFTRTKLKKLIKDFGKELKIEPISFKRALKDLIIDTDDFNARFDLLDAYVEGGDKKKYKKLIREYYASDILKYNENYFGDALFAFAYDMIQKYPQHKEIILKTISEPENGIWQHIDTTNKFYPFDDSLQAKVEYLKNEIIKTIPDTNSFVQKLSSNVK